MAARETWILGYLEHLSSRDLDILAKASGLPGGVQRLRAEPVLIGELLGDQGVFEAVYGDGPGEQNWLLAGSPFLVFAVAVARAARDLDRLPYLQEWAGPRQRIPVFVAEELREFAAEPLRRLFLAELLASYTHVDSGSVWVRSGSRLRRRRFSELDLMRLVSMLEALPEELHSGVYRRLGDLALFLTGVFPDYTAVRMFRPVDVQRLGRAVLPANRPSPAAERLQEVLELRGAIGMLELLGQRWYQLAAATSAEPARRMVVVTTIAERFEQARRVLNYVTDRYVFPLRERWFPAAPA
ncbi:MAG: hypothetical protein M3380_06810 [Chloroflexota bacterium]|nr:hypothetical protein [Chloroflexota bacterium]